MSSVDEEELANVVLIHLLCFYNIKAYEKSDINENCWSETQFQKETRRAFLYKWSDVKRKEHILTIPK